MRSLVRTISAIAIAVLVTLVPATVASAKKPKAAAWAKKHDFSGAWRAKDADRDGVKNYAEFKLGTDPRKADTDKDGLSDGDEVESANDPLDPDSDGDDVKDGAEHAGVVTALNGDKITIRQFKGAKLTVTLDSCEDVVADDSSAEDEGFVDATEDGDWGDIPTDDVSADSSSEEEEEVDLGDDEGSGAVCDFTDVEVGTVFTSAELALRDGVTYLVAAEIA